MISIHSTDGMPLALLTVSLHNTDGISPLLMVCLSHYWQYPSTILTVFPHYWWYPSTLLQGRFQEWCYWACFEIMEIMINLFSFLQDHGLVEVTTVCSNGLTVWPKLSSSLRWKRGQSVLMFKQRLPLLQMSVSCRCRVALVNLYMISNYDKLWWYMIRYT